MEDLFVACEQKKTPEKKLIELLFRGADTIEKMIVQSEKDGITDIKVEGLIAEMKKFMRTYQRNHVDAEPENRSVQGSHLSLSVEQKKQVNGRHRGWETGLRDRSHLREEAQVQGRQSLQLVRRMSQMVWFCQSASSPAATEVKEEDLTVITIMMATQRRPRRIGKAAKDVIGM